MTQKKLFETVPVESEIKPPVFIAKVQENFYKEYIVSPQWKKKQNWLWNDLRNVQLIH